MSKLNNVKIDNTTTKKVYCQNINSAEMTINAYTGEKND